MGITVICGAIAVVCSDQLGLAMAIVGSLAGAGSNLIFSLVVLFYFFFHFASCELAACQASDWYYRA